MTRFLIALYVLFCAGVAGGEPLEGGGCYTDADGVGWCVEPVEEEDSFVTFVSTDLVIQFPEPLSCITTEFCGDPAEDSDVRCVQATVCGEPIR